MGLGQVRRKLEGLAAVGQHALVGNIQIAIDPEESVAIGYSGIGPGISRIDLDGLGKQFPGGAQIFLGGPADGELRPGLQIDVVGLRIRGRPRRDRLQFLRQQLQSERGDDVLRDIVLEGKDIREVPIEALGPEMAAGRPVGQLRGYANSASRLPHAAFQDISDLQPAGQLIDLDRPALEAEGRAPGDDEDGRHLREVGDDVLGDTVADVFLLRIAAHIREGEDDDRRLLRRGLRRQLFGGRCGGCRRALIG